ncbi:hypothetical protein [Aeromicrobium sp. Leaf350]|uniref:hypothetical protein n=1 Tax=Aeromicrobium sp. Leaf350 TaxID=2876565 RepID=UPI001E4BA715|nr:hypothetical protein [Aeromicrobium sp. Leaf350]
MTTDVVLLDLAATDPDQYLVRHGEAGRGPGWRLASDLAAPEAWPAVARAYADDLGSRSVVVGGSCALQGYAWRVATLSVGRWVAAGHGVPLAEVPLRVRLRSGRTVGLAVGAFGADAGPSTPEDLAADLVRHLSPLVEASRTVSRLTPRVAWGNVGSAVASAWRRAHDAAGPQQGEAVLEAARACLDAPAWPWPEVPLDWQARPDLPLRYRRSTCCLIRLAPEHRACTACPDLEPAENDRRWSEAEAERAPAPRIPVGAHVGG